MKTTVKDSLFTDTQAHAIKAAILGLTNVTSAVATRIVRTAQMTLVEKGVYANTVDEMDRSRRASLAAKKAWKTIKAKKNARK